MTTKYNSMPADIIESQLESFRAQLATDYPGYPERTHRLILATDTLGETALSSIVLPRGGDWMVKSHKPSVDFLRPTEADTDMLRKEGYDIDDEGRPLHPWLRRLATDASLGLVGGKADYYHWGPNHTADPIVVWNNHMLFIQRRDTGDWALPGGYVDPGERPDDTAARETLEEASLDLGTTQGNQIYVGPVVDPRMTAHAWPETSAYLFEFSSPSEPYIKAGDDAKPRSAKWISFDELSQYKLFGSHRLLADLALTRLH